MLMNHEHGLTLIEIIAAAVIGSLLAAGALIAFLTAIRISGGSSQTVEATYFAQQTLDRFRNRIACDDPWFNPAEPACDPTPPSGEIPDELPAGSTLVTQFGGSRTYTVEPGEDFDKDGQADYLILTATVTWNPPQ